MATPDKKIKNTTLLKLKGTPFKSATDLKNSEERILKQEWESVERARVRRELLRKDENQQILAPFMNGFKVNFVGPQGHSESLLKVHMGKDESVHVDIDQQLRSKDSHAIMEGLVKSLIHGFLGGYLNALGLKSEEPLFQDSMEKTLEGQFRSKSGKA